MKLLNTFTIKENINVQIFEMSLIEKQSSTTQNVHCDLSSCNLFCLVKSLGDKSQRTIQLIIQVAIQVAMDIVALNYFSTSVLMNLELMLVEMGLRRSLLLKELGVCTLCYSQ